MKQMSMFARRSCRAALATATLAGALSAGLMTPQARADQALLIGVNTYPNLKQGNLQGCVNDVNSMTAQLKKRGFTTTIITNEQATKAGILAAIDGMRAKTKPNERFIFFYAGHGTRAAGGGGSLLPSDAREGTEEFDLPAALLYERLSAIPARARTAILDSCFSGGMMRSKGARGITSRFYKRNKDADDSFGAKDLVMVKVNKPTQTEHLQPTAQGPVCYFAASKANQEAGEDDFNRERHGVFTYHLLQEMNKLQDLRVPWNVLQKPVISAVTTYMDDLQQPLLSGPYVNTLVFESSQAAPTPAPPTPTPVPTVTPTPAPEPPKEALQLKLSITPSTFSEGAGPRAAVGRVSRNGSTNGALTVTLSSSDTGEATVPSQLVIPRGQREATFVVAAVDDRVVDGARQAVVTAGAATNILPDSVTLTVNDNDVAPKPTPTSKPTPVPTPVETNLWDEFNGDHADPSKIQLLMEPDQSAVKIGDQFNFRVQVGAPGYLIIVERGTSGKLNLIYPQSNKVDDAYLAGPTRIPADAEWAYEADQAGNERLKAILFTSKERAGALLDKLPKPNLGVPLVEATRDLKLSRVKVPPTANFYTADLMFAVLDKDGKLADTTPQKPLGLAAP
jgi:hypothetical protein